MKVETSFLYSTNGVTVSSSSNIDDFPITNLTSPDKQLIWLSEESLPQYITFDISSMKSRPLVVHGFGIYCGSSTETNPKIVEILIAKHHCPFISLGSYELSLCSGTQVLTTDEILFFDIAAIKIVIKETYGGYRTYINKVYIYEHLPETESVTKVTDSRERNLPRSKTSARKMSNDGDGPMSGKVLYTRTSEILISESELSENRRMSGKALPTQEGENNNNNKNIDLNGNLYSKGGHETSIEINNSHRQREEIINNNNQNNLRNNINIIDNIDNDNDNEENKLIISDPQFENNKIPISHHEINNINTNGTNIDKYIQTTSEDEQNNINHLLHSQNSNVNPIRTPNSGNNLTPNTNNNDYLLNEMKNFEITTKEYIDNFDYRIINLESNLSSIKSKLNLITSKFDHLLSINPQMQYQNNNNNENNKSNTNIQSLNSSIVSNQRESHRKFHFEEALNKKIEEKFADFTKSLEDRIYKSLLKPTLEHLEANIDKNLQEIKKQIRSAQKHHRRSNSKCKTTNKKHSSLYEKELQLDSLINKLQSKLVTQYNTTSAYTPYKNIKDENL